MKGTVVEDAEDELGEEAYLKSPWPDLENSLLDSLWNRLRDGLWIILHDSLDERNRRGR
jgi:hypothetical protein